MREEQSDEQRVRLNLINIQVSSRSLHKTAALLVQIAKNAPHALKCIKERFNNLCSKWLWRHKGERMLPLYHSERLRIPTKLKRSNTADFCLPACIHIRSPGKASTKCHFYLPDDIGLLLSMLLEGLVAPYSDFRSTFPPLSTRSALFVA